MKVKDIRLHCMTWKDIGIVDIRDQDNHGVFTLRSGHYTGRTKAQTIALANRLCDRFNAGQEEKP